MAKDKAKKITITDIAKKANVSIATISRAINPEMRSRVSAATLDEIDRLVEKFHFAPNLAAKNLRATKLKTIGFLIPHVPNVFVSDYHSKIFSGVSNALIDSDYRLKLVALKPYAHKLDCHPFRSAEGVDGLIIDSWPWYFSKEMAPDVPCVIVNDSDPKVRAHFVTADNERGGELAAEYLYRRGHERIAILTGHEWSTDSALRVKGFRSFFAKQGTGIPNEMVFRADYEEAIAAKLVERLFLEKKKITAFFCCNDNMAIGVLAKLKQLGIKCPKEVSVVGFDDDGRSAYSDPPLTTIRMHTSELGKVAADILLNHLRGDFVGQFNYKQTVLPVSLIERKSAAKAK